MSYCVNCGVELDKTCSVCPLCHTKVYNPKQPVDTDGLTPFPTISGSVEPVKRHEFMVLMTIIFLTTSVVCGLLNLFVFPAGRWSLYVIGGCGLFWIFLLPAFFPSKITFFFSSILDGISIALYVGGISALHPGNGWYLHMILPAIILATVLIQIFHLFSTKRKTSIIVKTAVLLGDIAVFCTVLELLIDFHLKKKLSLSWSAVVLACCAAIDVIIITIFFQKGLREELRKRMHF